MNMKKEIEWISVSERLPITDCRSMASKWSKESARVLVYNKSINFIGTMRRRRNAKEDIFVSSEKVFDVYTADFWAEIPLPE